MTTPHVRDVRLVVAGSLGTLVALSTASAIDDGEGWVQPVSARAVLITVLGRHVIASQAGEGSSGR